MKRFRTISLAVALACAPGLASAQSAPMVTPAATAAPTQTPLSAAEATFYHHASAALNKLYPKPAAAIKAGWFRYSNEDDSGAISYVNPHDFETPDVAHPQQLWYDVRGRLLGADFSQLAAAHPNGPHLFGIAPARFSTVPLHIHYGVKKADGTIEYGWYVNPAAFTAAGLNPLKPTATDLVKLGKVKSVTSVAFVFANLKNFDATMWLIPNPAGQFADKNPNVKPSANQGKVPSERTM